MLTHILRHYLPNANLPHIAGCCCLAYFSAISVSICTKLARSILMRDRNIATEPNFRKSLSQSRNFDAKKQLLVNFGRLRSNTCCCSRSIDRDDVSPAHWHLVDALPRPIAHKSKKNSRSITKSGRMVLYDTCYIAHQFQGQQEVKVIWQKAPHGGPFPG